MKNRKSERDIKQSDIMIENRRPSKRAAMKVIEAFLADVAPGFPTFHMCEDGDDGSAPGKCGWAFWICPHDTTSYLNEDLSIEWYGTSWPDVYEYDGDTGKWIDMSDAKRRGPRAGALNGGV